MDQATISNMLTVLNVIGGAVCALLYRSLVGISDRTSRVERELGEYKLHVAETYMTAKAMENVLAKLDRIEDKLDSKQDKGRP